MSLTRVVLAWLATSAWFALAELALARLKGAAPTGRGPAPKWVPAVEGFIFTLFGALWFGSFGPGRGGWILLFVLLGLLLELPLRLRDAVQRAQPRGLAAAVSISVLRWVVAGGILAALM
jgi:Trk-type K+ transport system membrane component